MGYADAKKIPFVALVGEDEISSGKITVKDMSAGTQEQLSIEEIVARLKPGIEMETNWLSLQLPNRTYPKYGS